MFSDDEERPPTVSLTAAAHEFDLSRDTLKRRLNATGARPNDAGRYRVRDVLLAVQPDVISPELRARIEAERAVERFRAPMAELSLALDRSRLSAPARAALDALLELVGAP